MKRLFFLLPLLLCFSCVKSQQILCCQPILISAGSAIPIANGLVTDFNFANSSSVTQVSGNVSSITDAVGSVTSSQSNSSYRPAYHTSGGPANTAYATFNGSNVLTGSLLTSSTNFTIMVIRRVAIGSNPNDGGGNSVFFNGDGNTNGYGIVDWQGGNIKQNSGGYLPGTTGNPSDFFYTSSNMWEIVVYSHSSGVNSVYNTIANKFVCTAPTSNGTTPTTSHTIGGGGPNNFKGDLTRIVLYNRQLSDGEVSTMCGYFTLLYSLPVPGNYNAGGDSITAGTGDFVNWPSYLTLGLLPTNLLYLNLSAVPGRTSANVLAGLSSEVIAKYNSGNKNVYSIMIGHNDFASSVPAATLLANTDSIIIQAHRAGYKVIVLTTLRTTGYSYSTTDTYNASLKANVHGYGCDSIVDIAAIPQLQDPTNTTYFIDGVHPTLPLGASYISNAVSPVVQYYLTH